MNVQKINLAQRHEGCWCEALILQDGPLSCGCEEEDCIVVCPGVWLCPCGKVRWMMPLVLNG
jgi:hypothetical protein